MGGDEGGIHLCLCTLSGELYLCPQEQVKETEVGRRIHVVCCMCH